MKQKMKQEIFEKEDCNLGKMKIYLDKRFLKIMNLGNMTIIMEK